jgi:hypothetical protein
MAEVEIPKPSELHELAELGKERFTKRVALVTAAYAVVLAVGSLGGNNAAKEMMLAQQQSSNLWTYYQAKAMREHLYASQRLLLEAGLAERGHAMNPDARAKYEALLKKARDEEVRYRSEKAAIEKEAKQLERERDTNRAKDPYFDYGSVLLQIAIVLASLAILSGARPVFVTSLGFAGLGALLSANGFLLFFQLPFLK